MAVIYVRCLPFQCLSSHYKLQYMVTLFHIGFVKICWPSRRRLILSYPSFNFICYILVVDIVVSVVMEQQTVMSELLVPLM